MFTLGMHFRIFIPCIPADAVAASDIATTAAAAAAAADVGDDDAAADAKCIVRVFKELNG